MDNSEILRAIEEKNVLKVNIEQRNFEYLWIDNKEIIQKSLLMNKLFKFVTRTSIYEYLSIYKYTARHGKTFWQKSVNRYMRINKDSKT